MSKLKMALGAIALASTLALPLSLPASAASPGAVLTGVASWYGPKFQGRPTANGETFDMTKLTAAHPSLPFDTRVRVTNPKTGKSVVVRINDRGPFAGGRVIDLSRDAAKAIGLMRAGVGKVRIEVLGPSA